VSLYGQPDAGDWMPEYILKIHLSINGQRSAERNIDQPLNELQKTFYRQRQSKIDGNYLA
jgi:hypothetical protein